MRADPSTTWKPNTTSPRRTNSVNGAHAAEDGVDVTVLMAKSGHRDIRTLARYARPSIEHAQRRWEQAREHHDNGR